MSVMREYAFQLPTIFGLCAIMGFLLIGLLRHKGRPVVDLVSLLLSGVGIIGTLLSLEGALNLERGLTPTHSDIFNPETRAWIIGLAPILLAAAFGFGFAKRVEDFLKAKPQSAVIK
ncbi:hypothetical protein [Microvirga solisilvae]|uniref:hypothetical protein n=1 Tax=Microvirga solisilvae TaxID=2919498 RepID=UPI001FAEA68F|nr:hypothetical protein [Microvirga solisilvae]